MQKPDSHDLSIAVIIPVYNEPLHFIQQLDQLINANVFSEIIVVMSKLDLSANAALLADAIKQKQIHQPNLQLLSLDKKGRAYQMNNGALAASSETLLFLHADTIIDAKACALEINHAMKKGFHWGRFDVNITTEEALKACQKLGFFSIALLINLRSKYTKISTGDQAIFINSSLFQQQGSYQEIPLMEDVALCKKLKDEAINPYCSKVKVNTSGRRWLTNGMVKTVILMWRIRYRYWHGDSAESLAVLYKEAR